MTRSRLTSAAVSCNYVVSVDSRSHRGTECASLLSQFRHDETKGIRLRSMDMKRRILWLLVVLTTFAGLALLIPGSPAYLLNFFGEDGRYYDEHAPAYWINMLDNPDPYNRYKALFALGSIGRDAGEAVPAVARHMREDPEDDIRAAASLALLKMVPASRSAVAALGQALKDPYLRVRMNAAFTLLRLREEAQPATDSLIQALEDEDNQTNLNLHHATIQEVVALALARASGGDPQAVAALIVTLRSAATEEICATLARAIGEMGAPARSALPPLQTLVKHPNPDVRRAAQEAIQHIRGDSSGSANPTSAGSESEELSLPEAQRHYLWDIEHHGNLLVKHGFGPLAKALKNADRAALLGLLSDDFTGRDLNQPRHVRAVLPDVEVERFENAGHPPRSLSRREFADRLLSYRKLFADKPPEVKLALMTLHPQQRGRLEGLWEGTAQLRLWGESVRGAPAEVILLLQYQMPQPTEQTLARPGWLRSAGLLQAYTAQSAHYLFAEVTRQRGLDPSKLHDNWKGYSLNTNPGGIYVCDFDRDGILDVLVTDPGWSALYRGRPEGMFEDVTLRYGFPRQLSNNTVAAWVDLDGDGWEDLILAGRIFRNENGSRFVDYTDRCNLHLPHDLGSIVVADYDGDGKLDLYVTRSGRPGTLSWLDGKSNEAKGNYLFHNQGDWKFQDVSKASGTRGGKRSTFTAAWLDANNDGWPDLHVINEFGDGVLLVNNRNGTFAEHVLADHPADFGTMGVAVGDINNDGNMDIYCANMYSKAGNRVIGNLAPDAYSPAIREKMRRFVAGSQLHLNQGGLQFTQVGPKMQVAAVGWAYGACLADLDNDGWLDIYATAGYVSSNRNEPDG